MILLLLALVLLAVPAYGAVRWILIAAIVRMVAFLVIGTAGLLVAWNLFSLM